MNDRHRLNFVVANLMERANSRSTSSQDMGAMAFQIARLVCRLTDDSDIILIVADTVNAIVRDQLQGRLGDVEEQVEFLVEQLLEGELI